MEEASLPRQEYQRLTKNMAGKHVPAIRQLLKVATFKNAPVHLLLIRRVTLESNIKIYRNTYTNPLILILLARFRCRRSKIQYNLLQEKGSS